MKKNRRSRNRRGVRGGGVGGIDRAGGRGAGITSRKNPNSPTRASSSPVVGGAQGGSGAGGSYCQVARRGTGGHGDGAVSTPPSTCASYMAEHGKVNFDELPARPDVLGKKKGDAFMGDFLFLAHGNLEVAAELKMKAAAKAAQAAAAAGSTPAAIGETAGIAAVATTTAAIDADSTETVDAAPAAEAMVGVVDAIRPTATDTTLEATHGVPKAAASPVVAETLLVQAEGTASGAQVTTDAERVIAADGDDSSMMVAAESVTTVEMAEVAPAATVDAGAVAAVDTAPAAAGAPTDQVGHAAAVGVTHAGEVKATAAIMTVSTGEVSAADVGPTAADVGPAAPDVGPAAADINSVAHGGAVAVATAGTKGQPVAADVVAANNQVSPVDVGPAALHVGPAAADTDSVAQGGAAAAGMAHGKRQRVAANVVHTNDQVSAADGGPAAADVGPAAAGIYLVFQEGAVAAVTAGAKDQPVTAVTVTTDDQVYATDVGIAVAEVASPAADIDLVAHGAAAAVGAAGGKRQSVAADVVGTDYHVFAADVGPAAPEVDAAHADIDFVAQGGKVAVKIAGAEDQPIAAVPADADDQVSVANVGPSPSDVGPATVDVDIVAQGGVMTVGTTGAKGPLIAAVAVAADDQGSAVDVGPAAPDVCPAAAADIGSLTQQGAVMVGMPGAKGQPIAADVVAADDQVSAADAGTAAADAGSPAADVDPATLDVDSVTHGGGVAVRMFIAECLRVAAEVATTDHQVSAADIGSPLADVAPATPDADTVAQGGAVAVETADAKDQVVAAVAVATDAQVYAADIDIAAAEVSPAPADIDSVVQGGAVAVGVAGGKHQPVAADVVTADNQGSAAGVGSSTSNVDFAHADIDSVAQGGKVAVEMAGAEDQPVAAVPVDSDDEVSAVDVDPAAADVGPAADVDIVAQEGVVTVGTTGAEGPLIAAVAVAANDRVSTVGVGPAAPDVCPAAAADIGSLTQQGAVAVGMPDAKDQPIAADVVTADDQVSAADAGTAAADAGSPAADVDPATLDVDSVTHGGGVAVRMFIAECLLVAAEVATTDHQVSAADIGSPPADVAPATPDADTVAQGGAVAVETADAKDQVVAAVAVATDAQVYAADIDIAAAEVFPAPADIDSVVQGGAVAVGVAGGKHQPVAAGVVTADNQGSAAVVGSSASDVDSAVADTDSVAQGGGVAVEAAGTEDQPVAAVPVDADDEVSAVDVDPAVSDVGPAAADVDIVAQGGAVAVGEAGTEGPLIAAVAVAADDPVSAVDVGPEAPDVCPAADIDSLTQQGAVMVGMPDAKGQPVAADVVTADDQVSTAGVGTAAADAGPPAADVAPMTLDVDPVAQGGAVTVGTVVAECLRVAAEVATTDHQVSAGDVGSPLADVAPVTPDADTVAQGGAVAVETADAKDQVVAAVAVATDAQVYAADIDIPAAEVSPAPADIDSVAKGGAVAVGVADGKHQSVAADVVTADNQGSAAGVGSSTSNVDFAHADIDSVAQGGKVAVEMAGAEDQPVAAVPVDSDDEVSAVDVDPAAADVGPAAADVEFVAQEGAVAVGTTGAEGPLVAAVAVAADVQVSAVDDGPAALSVCPAAAADIDSSTQQGAVVVGMPGAKGQPVTADVVAADDQVSAAGVGTAAADAGSPAADVAPMTLDVDPVAQGGAVAVGTVVAECLRVAAEVATTDHQVSAADIGSPSADIAPAAADVAIVAQGGVVTVGTTGAKSRPVAAVAVVADDQVYATDIGIPAAEVSPAPADIDSVAQGGAVAVGAAGGKHQPVAADVVTADDLESTAGVGSSASDVDSAVADIDSAAQGGEVAVETPGAEGPFIAAVAVAVDDEVSAVDVGPAAPDVCPAAADIDSLTQQGAVAVGTPSAKGQPVAADVVACDEQVSAADVGPAAADDGPPVAGVASATLNVDYVVQGGEVTVETAGAEDQPVAAVAVDADDQVSAVDVDLAAADVGPAAADVDIMKQGGVVTVGTTGAKGRPVAAVAVVADDQGYATDICIAAPDVCPAAADIDSLTEQGVVVVGTADAKGQSVAADVVAAHNRGFTAGVGPAASDVDSAVADIDSVARGAEVTVEAAGPEHQAVAAIAVDADDQVSTVGVGPAAADVAPATLDVDPVAQGGAVAFGEAGAKGQPVAAVVAATGEEGVPAMVAVFAEAAIDANEIPAAGGSAAEAGRGSPAAVAEVAVAASEMAEVAVAAAVAADADQEKAKDDVPVIPRGAAEAGEAAGAAAEAPPLSAADGNRTRWDWLEHCFFIHKVLTRIWAVVAFFILLECSQHVDPSRRGSTLSPGEAPLLPGEYIEGPGGFHKLGWIPGFSWKPKLVISPDGEMITQRRDGSEIVLAGADTGETKESVGLLCRGERLLRRVAHVAAPEYGARSQQGRLLLGQEHFCSVDASPATVSGVDVAQLWLTGGGVLGFSNDGDIEMVAPSGKCIWSLAQALGGDQVNYKGNRNRNDERQLNEKNMESTQNKTDNIENRILERAEEFKLRKKQRHDNAWKEREEIKQQKRARREEIKQQKQARRDEIKQQQRASRKNSPEWNDGAASGGRSDIASPSSESTLPRQNIFVRVWSWARQPSPKESSGQSG